MNAEKPVCLRCGNCCYFPDENGKKTKCKNLVKLPSGRTLCRVFKTRLGRLLYKYPNGTEIRCKMREDVDFNYPGCPFNKPGQPDANVGK